MGKEISESFSKAFEAAYERKRQEAFDVLKLKEADVRIKQFEKLAPLEYDKMDLDVKRADLEVGALKRDFDDEKDFFDNGADPMQPRGTSTNPFTKKVESAPWYSGVSQKKNIDPASFTVSQEARRDKAGNLKVYSPPSGDGGGSFEVAGITQRYNPEEAARLRALVQSGRSDLAEEEARKFIAGRAEPYTSKTDDPGLKLLITDTTHHRGEGGLRRVLQRATGSDSKDYGQLIADLQSSGDPIGAFSNARRDYEWEEVDRGRGSRAKFRTGLANRFDNAEGAARLITSNFTQGIGGEQDPDKTHSELMNIQNSVS